MEFIWSSEVTLKKILDGLRCTLKFAAVGLLLVLLQEIISRNHNSLRFKNIINKESSSNWIPHPNNFISSLKDNLNAEVALGTVTNVKEACAWLGYTYLFVRMKKNPLAYRIGWDEV